MPQRRMVQCGLRAVITALLGAALLLRGSLCYENSYVGAYRPFVHRPSQVTQIRLPCLHTTAPPPFNFDMRCPDTAEIFDWKDDQNAVHRVIRHAPLPGITSAMVQWFFSPFLPLLSPLVPYKGQLVYWYELWHPVDHKALIPKVLPNADPPRVPWPYTQIIEAYRSLPEEGHQQNYTVHAPMYIARIASPTPGFDIQLRLPDNVDFGLGASAIGMYHRPWVDTEAGLRADTEIVIGANQVVNQGLARAANTLITNPTLDNQLVGVLDQLTRHHIEEWGNFEYFLADLYDTYHPLSALARDALSASTGLNASQLAAGTPYARAVRAIAPLVSVDGAAIVGESEGRVEDREQRGSDEGQLQTFCGWMKGNRK